MRLGEIKNILDKYLTPEHIIALAENDYPPVDKYDEVYKEVFAQTENFKANQIKDNDN